MDRLQKVFRDRLQEVLIQKIWNSPEFKEKFCRDPKQLLAQQFGVELPAEVKVFVHQEKVDEIHIVVPKY